MQKLLIQAEGEHPTVVIFPDISANTMTLILDYIYTGNVGVCSSVLTDFLCLADLLQIHIDRQYTEPSSNSSYTRAKPEFAPNNRSHPCHSLECTSTFANSSTVSKEVDMSMSVKKMQRKIPNLMPISSLQSRFAKGRKGLYNHVIPSPWCPRLAPLLVDPRKDCVSHTDQTVSSLTSI